MVEALVGCVAGAALVDETKKMLEQAGFQDISLKIETDYVRQQQDFNDPTYRSVAENLPKGENLADYVVSLAITARK